MYKGIYIAASGAILKQSQLEVTTQNLANANTTGYKKDNISFKEYLFQEAGAVPDGRAMSDFSSFKTDLSSGGIIRTGNPLDVAIGGDGMIALEGGRYARRGDLKKNAEGYLATHNGTKVLGTGGPILLPSDSIEINIDSEGKISVIQPGSPLPVEIDTIKIVEFGKDGAISKTGDGQFVASGTGTPSTAGVQQGYLETSNVNTIKEMVHMIENEREYESYQKVIQIFDGLAAKINNQMGVL
jgi:flagellar basal-body rod protein FlgF